MKIKSFECPKSMKNYGKKKLGISDGWSMSRLSNRPSEPAYYIVDCPDILVFCLMSTNFHVCFKQAENKSF